ncbi:hypothetical protein BKA64DRAFT_404005 [Cadophora sp. MPI-SDFR-AT-0126]|nr:hypothetical protein BKA64DRAFT_404005 [Leotiomycetes sp. MPI-SDFR-AT-0126]
MWLIPNGLPDHGHPSWGGWGGRHNPVTWLKDLSREYGMSYDTVVTKTVLRYTSVQSTVWRWRDAFRDDFAARMHWTLHQNYSAATHPPIVNVNGSEGPEALHVTIPPGASITLDASETIDVDHPSDISQLEFEWSFYLEAGYQFDYGAKLDYIRIEPLLPPPGTDGKLSLNAAGFEDVAFGPAVSVTNLVPNLPKLKGRGWHVVLQVRTKKGPYPITRYKQIVIKSE